MTLLNFKRTRTHFGDIVKTEVKTYMNLNNIL